MNIPTPLRAITLHPWWAFAITHGDKRVEYRTRPLPRHLIDVPIALHAGASSHAERVGVRRGAGVETSECKRVQEAIDLGAPIEAWRWASPSSAFVSVVVFSDSRPAMVLGVDQ